MKEHLPGSWRLYGRVVAFVLVAMYAVGAVGHLLPTERPLMLFLTPVYLLFMGVLVVLPSLVIERWRFGVWMVFAYVLTFLVEAAGVATGSIFGAYKYGPTLGGDVHGVPLVIAFNWMLVVNGSVCFSARVVPRGAGGWRRPAIVGLAGLLAVAFDFIMEPVAMRLDYWQWTLGAVPFQNYLAWFVLAGCLAAFHPRHRHDSAEIGCGGNLAWFYVAVQAAFFAVLRLAWRFGLE